MRVYFSIAVIVALNLPCLSIAAKRICANDYAELEAARDRKVAAARAQTAAEKQISWAERIASGRFILKFQKGKDSPLEAVIVPGQGNVKAKVSGIEFGFEDSSQTHLNLMWTYTDEQFSRLGAQDFIMKEIAKRYPKAKSLSGSTTATNAEVIEAGKKSGLTLEAAFRVSPAYKRAAQAGFSRIDDVREIKHEGVDVVIYRLSKPD